MALLPFLVALALVQAAGQTQDPAETVETEEVRDAAQAEALQSAEQQMAREAAPAAIPQTVTEPVPVPMPVQEAPAYPQPTYAPQGSADRRIQLLPYDRDQIITLAVSPGFASVVELGDDERIENVIVGNSAGWQVTANKRGDRVIVKPLGGASASNLIVLTGSRRYVFVLDPFGESSFIMRFTYPAPTPAAAAVANASLVNYRFRGSKALFPLAMSDDGRRTVISWSEQNNLPAVFAVNGRKEQLVNGRMVGNDYVIEGAAPRYKFKYGKAEATAIRQTPKRRR